MGGSLLATISPSIPRARLQPALLSDISVASPSAKHYFICRVISTATFNWHSGVFKSYRECFQPLQSATIVRSNVLRCPKRRIWALTIGSSPYALLKEHFTENY